MAFPARRVLAGPVSQGGSVVENHLDAAPHPARALHLVAPDRFEDAHNLAGPNLGYGQIANHWVGVLGQGVGPLPGMVRRSPARPVRFHVTLSTVLEGNRARRR